MMGMKLGLVIEPLFTFGCVYVLSLCGVGGTYFFVCVGSSEFLLNILLRLWLCIAVRVLGRTGSIFTELVLVCWLAAGLLPAAGYGQGRVH